jgi:hypothetical protein
MTQWKGESVSEEEYNFNTFDKNKGQSGGALSNLSMEEPKTTGGVVTQTTEPKKEASQAEQLVNFLRSPDTQNAGIAAAVGVGTALAGKSLLGRGKNATQETPRVEPTFTEPTPFAPQKNAQPDVTDVASRPVGQSRPQLGGPTTAPAPVTPSVTPAPPAPSAPIPSAPAGGAPAPVNVASAPVAPVAPPAPAPVDPIMQAKLDAIADKQRRENEAHTAQQRRLDEIHQTKLANEAKRAELGLQKNQGKTASTTSVDAQATQLLVKSEENKLSKAVASATAPKPIASAVPPPVATVPTPTSPITASTPATTPAITPAPLSTTAPTTTNIQPKAVVPKVPEAGTLTKEEAGMKKYLISQYGGGTHGEQAYEKAIEILGKRPAYAPGEGGGLSPKENDAIKAWRKENIEGPKVNLTYDMKKIMKGAGGLAILASIPGFAEAAQRKDFGKMTDIASDFFVLPFAQSTEAGMPKAQEESLISQRFKEAQKLGSPYRSVPPPR